MLIAGTLNFLLLRGVYVDKHPVFVASSFLKLSDVNFMARYTCNYRASI